MGNEEQEGLGRERMGKFALGRVSLPRSRCNTLQRHLLWRPGQQSDKTRTVTIASFVFEDGFSLFQKCPYPFLTITMGHTP